MNDLWTAFVMLLNNMTFMELLGSSLIITCMFLLYCVGLFNEVS